MRNDNVLSPWAARFEKLLDKDVLKSALDRRPNLIPNLGTAPAHSGAELLRDAYEKLFVATPQRCESALRIIEEAHAYCCSTYPDKAAFVRGLYQKPKHTGLPRLKIITGLAGAGKSALLTRLLDILQSDDEVVVDHEPSRFPLQSASALKVGVQKSALQGILGMDICPEELRNKDKVNVTEALKSASKCTYERGVALIGADELQFFTKSAEANTLVFELLLLLCTIGPLVCAVMNYSLGHRLKARNHEDLDRLFQKPIVLEPETKDSSAWIDSVQGRIDVAPDVFVIDAKLAAARIHALTLGIDRYLTNLFILAYERSRRAGRSTVSSADLEAAYTSSDYSVTRETLQRIVLVRSDDRAARNHPDLVCPFTRSPETVAAEREAAKAQLDAQRQQKRLLDGLSTAEAARLKELERAASGTGRGKVVSMRDKKAITPKSLEESLMDFLNQTKKRKD